MQITIDRWVKSKESGREVDKIIDLGISLEALYVPEGGGDTTYKLAIRAARHLGKDKKDREDLLAKFKQIYNCRSKAVHAGHVDTTVKFGEEKISRSKFITHAQDLCLRSITKILDKGKFTDWDSLILGGGIRRGKQLNLSVELGSARPIRWTPKSLVKGDESCNHNVVAANGTMHWT